jgi:recombination associated protein RdgC
MPVFFKSMKLYRLQNLGLTAAQLNDRLAAHRYVEANNLEACSVGWISPCEHASNELVHAIDGQFLIMMRADRKLLPAKVVNKEAKKRAAEQQEKQGYKRGRKQMKEIKERVIDELLPKAFTTSDDLRIWVDTTGGFLVIESTTASKADEVIGLLAKCLDPMPLEHVYVHMAPAAAMTSWLAEDEAPGGFSIDQDTELRALDQSKAAIRYVKHSIDAEDVRRHIGAGKQCTRLAVTWRDRISFVLTDGLDFKKVSPLDVLKNSADTSSSQNEQEQFDSDFTLMTGEASQLIGDMLNALGGERLSEQ